MLLKFFAQRKKLTAKFFKLSISWFSLMSASSLHPQLLCSLATPLSSNPAHQFPSTPSPLAPPRRLDSAPGKNFKAPDRRLSAYSPAGDFRSVPGTPFPGGGGGLQSAPSLGAPARGGWFLLTLAYPLEACASRFTLAVLLAFIFIS